MPKPILLVIDDDEALLGQFKTDLQKYEVETARSREEALQKLSPPPDIVLLDWRLDEKDPSKVEGATLLKTLRQQFPALPVLMITAYGDVNTAVKCMRMGAVDFIQKPAKMQEIRVRLAKALEYSRLSRNVDRLSRKAIALERELRATKPADIIGQSSQIEEIRQLVRDAAERGDITVLIRGESGTGKELVARGIWMNGPRQAGPFIPVNVNTLPKELAEAELFGHVKGAFTGATRERPGLIADAEGGVLFLDEIGDLDPAIQVKLLRFLREREVRKVGDSVSRSVDVQVVAATNANLEEQIKEGSFRKDLFYRLNIFQITVPPLRERPEDIPLLANHFIERFRHKDDKIVGVSPAALKMLRTYSWPGNVAELENVIRRALALAPRETPSSMHIEVQLLSPEIRGVSDKKSSLDLSRAPLEKPVDFDKERARFDLALIERALQTVGVKDEAAKLLGKGRRYLYTRVDAIEKQHPDVLNEFPFIKQAFSKDSDG